MPPSGGRDRVQAGDSTRVVEWRRRVPVKGRTMRNVLQLPPIASVREAAVASGRSSEEVAGAVRSVLVEALAPLPAGPAVYALRDTGGALLTVGQAADLRSRLLKVDGPVVAAATVEYLRCGSPFEAALRHLAWLRELEPERYGPLLPYPPPLYLKLDLRARFPRFEPTETPDLGTEDPAADQARGLARPVRLFGPYPTRKALEAAEAALYAALPLRRCTWDVQGGDVDETCIYLQMRRCAAPCTGEVPVESYRRLVDAGADLLAGRPARAAADLAARRDAAAAALAFEEAARLQAALDRLARQPAPPAADLARWGVVVLAPALRPPRGPAAAAAFGFRAGRLVHEARLEPTAGDLEPQAAALALAVATTPEPPAGAAGSATRARAEEAALLVAWLGRTRPPASVPLDLDDPTRSVPAIVAATAALLARGRPGTEPAGPAAPSDV